MKQITRTTKTLFTIALFTVLMAFAKNGSACNAGFTHTTACAGDTVYFYALDQMAIYTWDFGDATSAININHDTTTAHVYNTPGTYYVTLFVNIGAEWDYQTQIITVGTDCFNPAFSAKCGGSFYEYFYDESTGATSRTWTFGDPASGVNNTSTATNPNHLYPSAGNYTVKLVISNGTSYDSITQIVNVPASCIGATIYPNISGNCLNDSTTMAVYYTGTITSYLWNFGDPASGANNVSTLSNPKHLYSGLGVYNAYVVITNGVNTDTAHIIQTIIDCTVWPGDCNRDGEVNGDDIFPIGMFYGGHGPARSAASNSYTSQPVADWPGFGAFMYLQDLVNEKMADCNGDSTINNMDMTAVNANFGMHHTSHNNVSGMPEAGVADPSMYIQFPSGTANAGTTVTATIYLGTASKPIAELYGYSFTFNYDPAQVVSGSVVINLSTNWLGNASNELMLTHDDYATGKADAAVVRFDKVQVLNGSGAIGTITFQLKPTATGTLHAYLSSSAKTLSTVMFGGGTASGSTEIFRPVNLGAADLLINPVGIQENAMDRLISVYPNPANEMINISVNGTEVYSIKVINAIGQTVYAESGDYKNNIQINSSAFANGIYSIFCTTKDGVIVKKISIN